MKTFLAYIGIAFVVIIAGGLITAWFEQEPKFHYGDKVKVSKGFYKGQQGVVEENIYWMGYEYYVDLTIPYHSSTRLHENELEVIELCEGKCN